MCLTLQKIPLARLVIFGVGAGSASRYRSAVIGTRTAVTATTRSSAVSQFHSKSPAITFSSSNVL